MSFLDKTSNRVLITVLWVIAFAPSLIIYIVYFITGAPFSLFSLIYYLSMIICTVFMFINLHKKPYNFSWMTKWAAIYYLISSSLVVISIIRFIIDGNSLIVAHVAELLAHILLAIYLFSFSIKKPKITLILFVISCVATLIQFILCFITHYNAILNIGVLPLITLGLLMRQKDLWECPVCHYSNRPNAKFCGQCGRQKDIAGTPDIHQPQ